MLGFVTFAHPALLWGAAACAAPVVIHLMLRPRPRRQALPTFQFLTAAHQVGVRRHRLRNFLLLALRTLALLLLVAALARPSPSGGAAPETGAATPAAVVVCIDDSTSMGYRFRGQTRLDTARAWAEELIGNEARFPAGSNFLVLSSSGAVDTGWMTQRAAVLQRVNGLHRVRGSRPLETAIQSAMARLEESSLGRRELYVLTDMTAHAWSGEVRKPVPDGVTVFVLDAGQDENRNARIGPMAGLRSWGPPQAGQQAHVMVSAGDEAVSDRVEVVIDGRTVGRMDPFEISAGGTREVPLFIPPLDAGLYEGEARLLSTDNNEHDNAWYFALEVVSPPRIVVATTGGGSATEAERFSAMLAPPTMPADRRRYQVDRVAAERLAEILSAASGPETSGSTVAFVIAVDPGPLPQRCREPVRAWIERGGVFLAVAGPHTTMEQWATWGEVLPASPRAIVECEPPVSIEEVTRDGQAADGDPLSRRRVFHFLSALPHDDAVVLARFSGGDAAVVERRRGAGRAIFWAFSLDPAWSDLGVRAAAALTLLHRTVAEGLVDGDALRHAARNVLCDETAWFPMSTTENRPRTRVETRSGSGAYRIAATEEGLAFVGEDAGVYRLYAGDDVGAIAVVAVNLDPAESDSARINASRLSEKFPGAEAAVLTDPADLVAAGQASPFAGDLTPFVLAILAGTLLFEAWLSNRFGVRNGLRP
jgi:hypothetical protein